MNGYFNQLRYILFHYIFYSLHFVLGIEILSSLAHSVNSDQTPRLAASVKGLHYQVK